MIEGVFMSRIGIVDESGWDEILKESLKETKKKYGITPNIDKVFAVWPEYHQIYREKFELLLSGDTEIPYRLKLLIYSLVGSLNQCQYAYFWNQLLMRQHGMPQEAIDAVLGSVDYRNSSLDEATRAALAFSEKLTRHAYTITDREVERLKQHFNSRQILEICSVAAFANEINMMASALGIRLESR